LWAEIVLEVVLITLLITAVKVYEAFFMSNRPPEARFRTVSKQHSTSSHEAPKRLPIRKYRLGEEPDDDLSNSTTPEERLAMVWELTARAWALTGQPLPEYDRRAVPVMIRRLQ
jgi:hypothetical protein